MIVEAIQRVVEGESLGRVEAAGVMEEIMGGQATDAQIAAFITALRLKGETIEEISGLAEVMRAKAVPVTTSGAELVDTCGTGGDVAGTFNISTTTAFVVAGAGVKIAKHGNRSVSSKCGSADVLEALGVAIELNPADVGRCIDEAGIGFLFAPLFHKAMKYAIGPRREIAIRTVFNILGPLTNPAGASAQIVGVYSPDLTTKLAAVLGNLGVRRAMVVHGADGLDEISNTGESTVAEYKDGQVTQYSVSPEQLGRPRVTLAEIKGGTAQENASILRAVLSGEAGPRRDITLMNAAAALVAADRAESLEAGVEVAATSIDSGAAVEKLERLVELSGTLAGAVVS